MFRWSECRNLVREGWLDEALGGERFKSTEELKGYRYIYFNGSCPMHIQAVENCFTLSHVDVQRANPLRQGGGFGKSH